MESRAVGNQSALSRLLEEISWEGRSVRRYRDGGRGLENVLTTEVFTALDFLPRQAFLGAVVDAAHGADEARRVLSREVEQAVITVLPTEVKLNPDGLTRAELMIVQPDAMITSSSCRTLVEAKRIRRSSFQPQQLAREYLAVTRPSGSARAAAAPRARRRTTGLDRWARTHDHRGCDQPATTRCPQPGWPSPAAADRVIRPHSRGLRVDHLARAVGHRLRTTDTSDGREPLGSRIDRPPRHIDHQLSGPTLLKE